MIEASNTGSRRRFLNRLTAMMALAFLGLSKTDAQRNASNIQTGNQKKIVSVKSLKDYKLTIKSDGQRAKSLLNELIVLIEQLPDNMEQVKGNRQHYETMFENFDQKTNQLFNILSTVIKTSKEMEDSVTRNILE